LRERGRLFKNAPHLVRDLRFVVPRYDWWEGPFYGVGLKLYDLLAGRAGFGTSTVLSREETLDHLPTLEPEGLRGGISYYDGQFDDARLAINMAQTAVDLGATVLNYMHVTALTKDGDMVNGAVIHDVENDREYELAARVVINATGIFTDKIRHMDDPEAHSMIRLSQGVHIVLDQDFLPGDSAIMVPRTDDARVLFAIPWHDRVLIGTTDTPIENASLEPRPLAEELDFLLVHAARYLTKDPTPADVLSTFAGIRPLVSPGGTENTAAISRDHTLYIARSGLVTITGGKWTTYRKMAEDTIDQAAVVAQLDERPSVTKNLHLHGWHTDTASLGDLAIYGTDADDVLAVRAEEPAWATLLHSNLSYRQSEVIWAARQEMARSVEDVLARRTRSLLLDARASIAAAPVVARLLASELNRDATWEKQQVAAYEELASGYLLDFGL
jgi:glycerol-3-phosphate dehydrogenase